MYRFHRGILILGLVFLLAGCAFAGAGGTPGQSTSTNRDVVVTVTYDEQQIRQQQEEVDQGHFPLRISDPAATGMEYLSEHFPDFGKVEKAPRYLKRVENKLAVVEIESGNKKYIVTLKKLARQDETGAWFVTKVEVVPLGK